MQVMCFWTRGLCGHASKRGTPVSCEPRLEHSGEAALEGRPSQGTHCLPALSFSPFP